MWQVSLLGYPAPDEFPWETTLLADHYPIALRIVGEESWPDTPHQTYSLSVDQAMQMAAVMGGSLPEDVREWELRVQRLYVR